MLHKFLSLRKFEGLGSDTKLMAQTSTNVAQIIDTSFELLKQLFFHFVV